MQVTARVKDNNGKTIGFMANNVFYPYEFVLQNMAQFKNLRISGSRIISRVGSLPVIIFTPSVSTVKSNLATLYPLSIIKDVCSRRLYSRDVQLKFEDWYAGERTGGLRYILYVEGARQTGKTTEILYFATKHYDHVIYINLATDQYAGAFRDAIKGVGHRNELFEDFLLSVLGVKYTNDSRTVLIIDEIQESSAVYNSLRTLRWGLKCDIIVSGSYLAVALNKEYFVPAGDLRTVEITPLSFREFTDIHHQGLWESASTDGSSPDSAYIILREEYNRYCLLGGYPGVISECERRGVSFARQAQQEVMNAFLRESKRYIMDTSILAAFDDVMRAATLLQLREKRGTRINTDLIIKLTASTDTPIDRKVVNAAVSWLYECGVFGLVGFYDPVSKMRQSASRLYFRDVGILGAVLDTLKYDNGAKSGLITETFAFNELCALHKANLVYEKTPNFSCCNNYELDFYEVKKGDQSTIRYGVEVKTQQDTAKSLSYYKKMGYIDKCILASADDTGCLPKDDFARIPVYLIGKLLSIFK